QELVAEAQLLVEQGYRILKLRFGDTVGRDIERLAAVRAAFGDDIGIMVDANTGYSVDDVRRVMPALVAQGVLWLEEPFPQQDYRSYETAYGFGGIALAAGENHFTRYEFNRVIEEKSIRILQPDLSKTGGITETLRIAAMASAYKLSINPHTSASGLNMAASIHLLASIENGGYFEADVAKENLFRDQLTSRPDPLDKDGCVRPPEAPGLGVEVDEEFLKSHPVIEGPAYV
ncbi:MAG: mandelate racemase/muconate lactonizing enzyme family protein, partial [Noviherbaspirillum sp.]